MNGEDSKDKKALEETMPLRSNLQLLQEIQQMLKDSSAEELDVDALEALLAELDEQAPVELDHDPEDFWKELMQKGEVPDENNIPKRPADERREVRWFECISFPRRFFKVAACILLVFSLCGSTVAMAHPEILDAVIGWFREFADSHVIYGEPPGMSTNTPDSPRLYRPTWVPNGYRESASYPHETGIDIHYFNEEGQHILFLNSTDPSSGFAQIEIEHCDHSTVWIGDHQGDLYDERREGHSSALVWTVGQNLFCIHGNLSEEEFIQIAESIVPIESITQEE